MSEFTVPGLSSADGSSVADILQERLSAYNDLHLTLKHVHWNVVGPNFIGVHEMIDPQVELVRGYADDVAERIAALGNSPKGTAGAIERDRTWDDYSVGRDDARAHLAALDLVYTGVITDSRTAIDNVGKIDPITEDMLIGQTAQLDRRRATRPVLVVIFLLLLLMNAYETAEANAPSANNKPRPGVNARSTCKAAWLLGSTDVVWKRGRAPNGISGCRRSAPSPRSRRFGRLRL